MNDPAVIALKVSCPEGGIITVSECGREFLIASAGADRYHLLGFQRHILERIQIDVFRVADILAPIEAVFGVIEPDELRVRSREIVAVCQADAKEHRMLDGAPYILLGALWRAARLAARGAVRTCAAESGISGLQCPDAAVRA